MRRGSVQHVHSCAPRSRKRFPPFFPPGGPRRVSNGSPRRPMRRIGSSTESGFVEWQSPWKVAGDPHVARPESPASCQPGTAFPRHSHFRRLAKTMSGNDASGVTWCASAGGRLSEPGSVTCGRSSPLVPPCVLRYRRDGGVAPSVRASPPGRQDRGPRGQTDRVAASRSRCLTSEGTAGW